MTTTTSTSDDEALKQIDDLKTYLLEAARLTPSNQANIHLHRAIAHLKNAAAEIKSATAAEERIPIP
jgi:hypothetical protein